jgi:hypothetical protein
MRDEAMEAIGSLPARLMVARRDGDGASLEFHGDLARILVVSSGNAKTPSRGETGFCVIAMIWLRGPETTESTHKELPLLARC